MSIAAGLAGSALVATTGWAGEELEADELPASVETSFTTTFPKAVITEMTREDEGGVVVYDIEFSQDDVDRSVEISVDGVVLETSTFVSAKDVPATTMKTIMSVAKGAEIRS